MKTLPREYFTSPDVFAEEQERIFARAWNCVGRTASLADPGDYIVRDVAGESIIVHCPVIHPELAAVLPYQSGDNDLTDGPVLGGSMEITPPNQSATMSGRACGRLVNPGLGEAARQHAYYYSVMPNLLLSIHADYVNYYLITPIAVDRTLVESEWLFAPENEGEDSFNPADAVDFWDVTNRQDWDIVERSQRGIRSRRYEPGPYSSRESIPAAWDRYYLRRMRGDGAER